ncbi:uncharacterized protein [Antedon mediterranea]|uniref:uncharacterized protein n=1 Tax=Antedon mediterranea TaxID=105859 RepID=UPI003AF5AB92
MSSTYRSQSRAQEWQGYEWQIHLDDIVDCDKCSPGCRSCYYKYRYLPVACKVGFIAALLSAIIVITALIIRFGSFGPDRYIVGNGDQIMFSDGSSQNDDNSYSRLFCSGLKLTSKSTPPILFNAYAVMNKARTPAKIRYALNDTLYLSYGVYVNIVHTFHQSDTMVIRGCMPDYSMDASLYIIRGEENYKKWSENRCSSCYAKETFKPCSLNKVTEVHLTFSSTDIVYFAYTLGYDRAELDLQFTFYRTKYLIKDIADACVGETSCSLSLPLHTADIVIEQEVRASEQFNEIHTQCEARISIYFAFFVAVPAAFVLFFTCCGFMLKRCQDDLIRDMERADRRRDYDIYGRRPTSSRHRPPSRTTTDRNNRSAVGSHGIPTFSSTSLSANRAISISATVPLLENQQLVGSLPPDYNSLIINQTNESHTANEPPPPMYNEVGFGIIDQSEHDQPPPAYDDVSNA